MVFPVGVVDTRHFFRRSSGFLSSTRRSSISPKDESRPADTRIPVKSLCEVGAQSLVLLNLCREVLFRFALLT